ncbi:deleted in malignant brain tumors 1 protein-like [Actinia tenebrosa]|uniref:Deleted in malignant brain tumors 1 protein-like n=1 Tax=Actinia tenebrosa TaxID=6105 RepID=A0A6P8IT86_ACTTE|nr:deleted in malignant brain tumors 1 protein-like [Actinia tenebrosa]
MPDAKVACRQLGFTKAVGIWYYGRGTVAKPVIRQWGTVCDGSWSSDDLNTAKVVCRQLGFTKTVGYSYRGRGTDLTLHENVQGQWGTVCGDWSDWDMDDAKVACRQLGFTKTVGFWWGGRGTGNSKILLGIRRALCIRKRNQRYNVKQERVTVCNRGAWDMPDAKVACRQLGFTKTVGYWYWGRGTGKVWLYYMRCTGSEASLGSCTHNGWGSVSSSCNSHTYDVGVSLFIDLQSIVNTYFWVMNDATGIVCDVDWISDDRTDKLQYIDLTFNGNIIQVYHSGLWGTVCHRNWNWEINDAKVACRQLGFIKAVGYWYWGRGTGSIVRVYHSGQWGTVCDYYNGYWDMNDAKVACRQLGFTKTVGYWYLGRGTDSGLGSIIQVYHSGQWGTVCDYNLYWDMRDAKVACRQLGYTKAVGYWQLGRGTGKVWLWKMGCSGTETSLGSCTHNRWGNRLRVLTWELYSHGWGTVCINDWDIRDAKVACRQLGFTKPVGYWWYGHGNGKVWLDRMQCSGSETLLESCSHNGWGNVNWDCPTHRYDVGVDPFHLYTAMRMMYVLFCPNGETGQDEAVGAVQRCIDDVRAWMTTGKLLLNDDKTECIVIGTK